MGFSECKKHISALVSLLGTILVMSTVSACSDTKQTRISFPATVQSEHWLGSWASSQQIPEPGNALPKGVLSQATLRQVVRLSYGGTQMRIRISNQYGNASLRVENLQIAMSNDPHTSAITADTSRELTFLGENTVNIPAGAIYTSDPITFPVNALDHVVVSMYFPKEPQGQTSHPGSRATSYVMKGQHATTPEFTDAHTVAHWYQLSSIEVKAPSDSAAIIILGDSITDGYGTKPNTDTRWPDFLMSRLQAHPDLKGKFSILNHGVGGNNMLRTGLGPSAAARYDEDVLDQRGGKYLILLEGVNDLGNLARNPDTQAADYNRLVTDLKMSYSEIAKRSREHGITPIGGTIMPFWNSGFYQPNAIAEQARQDINSWIRSSKTFDTIIDFDEIMRDPKDPKSLNPQYDSGDHLHPSIAGYKAMADHIPLEIFLENPRTKQ